MRMTIFAAFKDKNLMKYYFFSKKITPLLIAVLFFCSCAYKKDIVYYQNIDSLSSQGKQSSYEIKIQPDDLLMIIVSAEDQESAIPFNFNSASNGSGASGQNLIQSYYLVNSNGAIDFPVLGKFKISGLSKIEVIELFKQKLSKYIKNPIINLRIMNFKVSLQGEVNAPGNYTIASERITLIEALALAKDLTIYGKRDNILIIREIDGVKSYNRVDITKSDFMNSPFYYLVQNDVVYVEPNRNRINAAAVSPNTGMIVSITSILITVISFMITITK
jgi:polysaccharide export outer membrane protein